MGVVSWIVFGLLAGALAKLAMPGRDPGGVLLTIAIGIAGALLGGAIAAALGAGGVGGFDFWSFLVAVGGALLLLVLYRVIVPGRRART